MCTEREALEHFNAAGQDNGRIAQSKDWKTGEEVSYTYHALNRLIGVATTGPEWGQSYTYDGFGNLRTKTVTKGTATTFSVSINGATNRMAGVQSDASGNQLAAVAQPWNPVYQYDGENRLVGTAGQAYGYDPANRRVWKRSAEGAQVETVYFYGADRALLGTGAGRRWRTAWARCGWTRFCLANLAVSQRLPG